MTDPQISVAFGVLGNASRDAGILHYYCECDPDRALCGLDITDFPETEHEPECVVCVDLGDLRCPRCGYDPQSDRLAMKPAFSRQPENDEAPAPKGGQ